MSAPKEHDAAAVEALAKELATQARAHLDSPGWCSCERCAECWRKAARFILDREAGLVAALEDIVFGCGGEHRIGSGRDFVRIFKHRIRDAEAALAVHRAASAPKEPTPKYIVGFDPAEPSPGDGACAMIFNKHELAVEAVVRGNITEREAQAMCDALARERQQVKP